MIVIQEVDVDNKKLDNLLKKMGKTQYSMNKQLIIDDINKLTKRSAAENTRVGRSNLKNTIKYLERMYSLISTDESIGVEWEVIDNKIKTYPLQFINVDVYNINTMDYFIRGDKSSVLIDYTRMMDMIAFQISYKDMGITLETMEDILKDTGIIAIYDAEIILSNIPELTHYKSKAISIKNCNFINDASKEGVLFFPCNKSKIASKTYREILEKSYNEAMKRVTYYILKEVSNTPDMRDSVLLGCVFEKSIHYVVSELTPGIISALSQPILIKILGRKFEFKPTIRIY